MYRSCSDGSVGRVERDNGLGSATRPNHTHGGPRGGARRGGGRHPDVRPRLDERPGDVERRRWGHSQPTTTTAVRRMGSGGIIMIGIGLSQLS